MKKIIGEWQLHTNDGPRMQRKWGEYTLLHDGEGVPLVKFAEDHFVDIMNPTENEIALFIVEFGE